MKIAIFHDFLDQKGGGERLVLETAKNLNADIITAGFDKDILSNLGFKDQKVIVLPSFTTNKRLRDFSAAFAFLNCNFSNSYDFFIFSGALTLFASNKHSPNFFYCHETPEGILKPIFKLRIGDNTEYGTVLGCIKLQSVASTMLYQNRYHPELIVAGTQLIHTKNGIWECVYEHPDFILYDSEKSSNDPNYIYQLLTDSGVVKIHQYLFTDYNELCSCMSDECQKIDQQFLDYLNQ